jgi:D-galactose 1-dehydrogenase
MISTDVPRLPWRCGIVGLGRIGQLYHALLTNEVNRASFSVIAVATPQPSFHPAGLTIVNDYRQLLAQDLDVILVATPPSVHYEISKAALLAGKDVLVEKPPTQSLEESQELIALSAETKRVLFFAFHARYNWAVQRARAEIGDDEVLRVEAAYKEDVLRYHASNSWVFSEGVLRDSGINLFSVICALLPSRPSLGLSKASLHRAPGLAAITKAWLTLTLGGREIGFAHLDWQYLGQEVREVVVRTARHEFRIDIVTDSLHRDGVLVERDQEGGGQLGGEYTRLFGDFRRHLESRESFCSLDELRLVEAGHRIATECHQP